MNTPADSTGSDDALAAATARLCDARARFVQAEAEHDGASGHEKAETYGPMEYWRTESSEAHAAWRALAGAEAPEPE